MKKRAMTIKDLKREIESFKESYHSLTNDNLFVLWFLRACVTEDLEMASRALTGAKGDKGIDAIFIDEKSKMVFFVQGKYRETLFTKNESRADIMEFAKLAQIMHEENETYKTFSSSANPEVKVKLDEARNRLFKRDYTLHLYYVTLGKCSTPLEKEAIETVKRTADETKFEIVDGKRILLLLSDYIEGVAPPVPSAELEMETGSGVKVTGVLQRYDSKTDIDSWVFPMSGNAIAEIYAKSGQRIFARNVRGFLGATDINRNMEETIDREPEYFWYYNNGITIVCDKAEQRSSRGKEILYVENPQIINGQQTTRTLFKKQEKTNKASVIVKVIRVPRMAGNDHTEFEKLVSSIVAATNWQNAILPSDLRSNDQKQIELERELRKRSYLYLRKRQSKSEARSIAGANHFHTITKEGLARAVAACDLDPSVLRLGKEILFEEDLYGVIFGSSNLNYYLNRYWVSKRIRNLTKGFPERGYARWLVTHFVWNKIDRFLKTDAASKIFHESCKYPTGISTELEKSANYVFKSAIAFYKAKRGKGEKAIDVSSFFKLKKINGHFESFWKGSLNKHRKPFLKHHDLFQKYLKDAGQ